MAVSSVPIARSSVMMPSGLLPNIKLITPSLASSLMWINSILDFDSREVAVSRTILKNARTRILVADQSKFERNAPVRICNLSELDYVILDREPPGKFLEVAKSCGTRVVTGETASA